jgi:hypothetical protein
MLCEVYFYEVASLLKCDGSAEAANTGAYHDDLERHCGLKTATTDFQRLEDYAVAMVSRI